MPDDRVPVRHGAHALVVPVTRWGRDCVLKVSHRGLEPAGEVLALRTWDGQGAVQLLEADEGGDVLLLERLDAAATLGHCPPGQVGPVAGRLIRRLSVPAPAGLTTARAQAGAIAATIARPVRHGDPLPVRWVRTAGELAEELRHDDAPEVLVHADLTTANVLRRIAGEWVAIDPQPLAGPPERSVPELLLTAVDACAGDACTGDAGLHRLLADVVAAGGLDAERARAWVVVRAVDYWTWAVGAGLTLDPQRCRRLLAAFA
nr:aminoglycoside phosphotransferase family protein [Kineococcus siccus]